MWKHLNPVRPNPIKQIVENRIESHKESGRFDTVKFSKMLNTPVENEKEGLTFEERLELKQALGLMVSSIKEALAVSKATPDNLTSSTLDKSLVRRFIVQKALENVAINGLMENGANSPHKFTQDGYVYSDLRPMSSIGVSTGKVLFEEEEEHTENPEKIPKMLSF